MRGANMTNMGRISRGAAGMLARLVMLALVVRVIAVPFIMAAPAPGLIAICSGGKIIYVSMETGQPVQESVSAAGVDCPIVAAAQVVFSADLPLAAPAGHVIATAPAFAARIASRVPRCPECQPRAPPLSV